MTDNAEDYESGHVMAWSGDEVPEGWHLFVFSDGSTIHRDGDDFVFIQKD